MKISITDSRNPLPYSDYNNPKEYNDLTERQQTILKIWIAECLNPFQTKSHLPHWSSYSLKHRFEYSNYGFYVTNGQFKGAMLAAGFNPKEENTLNWTFRLGKKAADENDVYIPVV